MASSKRENFEGGLKLVRKVRCLFALIIALDVIILFSHSYNFSHYLKINVIYVIIALFVIFYLHLRIGIPIVLKGGKAEALFINLHPPVPKVGADEQTYFNSQQFNKIEHDDEGYIGAWQPPKSNGDKAEEKEREEEIGTKECPFCGTLNGIDNLVCDFCGADIPEQKE